MSARTSAMRHVRKPVLWLLLLVAAAAVLLPSNAYAAGSKSIYRLVNPYNGAHLITSERTEYDSLKRDGWKGEGERFQMPSSGGVSVYRLYNRYNGDHFWTSEYNEYTTLQRRGWTGEGVKLHGASSGVPIYRLNNQAMSWQGLPGAHLFTADRNEYNTLPGISGGAWHQEGIAFYATSKNEVVDPNPVDNSFSNPSYIDASGTRRATFKGTVTKETITSGWAHAGTYYVLVLPRPVSVRYSVPGGTYTQSLTKLLLDGTGIESYVGRRVVVTGSVQDLGNRWYVYPAFWNNMTIRNF